MSEDQVQLVVLADGDIRAIYSERIDLGQLGRVSIRRGSHVEPTDDGRWTADLSPSGGPMLGPFPHRSCAIDAEVAWLAEHWLGAAGLGHSIYFVKKIVWDCYGIDAGQLGLPDRVLIQGIPERFADILSDHFGWCVRSMEVEVCTQTLLDQQQRLSDPLPIILDSPL